MIMILFMICIVVVSIYILWMREYKNSDYIEDKNDIFNDFYTLLKRR